MLPLFLVVIRNFDIVGIAVAPVKAEAKLIVDSDAVLPSAIASEFFQAKARKRKIPQRYGCIKKSEFDARRVSMLLNLLLGSRFRSFSVSLL
jgi:hypothetical protein